MNSKIIFFNIESHPSYWNFENYWQWWCFTILFGIGLERIGFALL